MFPDDFTERVPPVPTGGAGEDAAPAGEPTEPQASTPADEPTEYQPLPASEDATLALPGALPPRPLDPPTVPVWTAAPRPPSWHDLTELTPLLPGDPPPRPSVNDPPTVAESNSATIRRAGPISVPGYELLDRLGGGTYGEVWLAQDERTGIRVAIKFLNHGTGIEWQLIQAEVKQLALLHTDPGIVQLLGVELDRQPPYYIMAYAEQGSLAHRLDQGPVPLPEALAIFRQLAEALAYVHAKGVRHCDLKPGNVLLKARGRALIADFGQAHLSSETTPALGTFFFMAPEQAELAKQIPDTRWDVYGLGAIFYAMLTGQPPREDAAVRERIARTEDLGERLRLYREWVARAPRPAQHRTVAGMDRHLAEIVDRCLESNPERRLRDAGSVLAALSQRERLLSQRPLLWFGFVAQIILCLVLGTLGFLGVQGAISETEAKLAEQLTPTNPHAAAVVEGGLTSLRYRVVVLGIVITGAVILVLSGLWGWLVWRLRHKERAPPGDQG